MPNVSFFTFCYSGDFDLLHQPGQLKRQVESNNFPFSSINVINQGVIPKRFIDVNPTQYHIRDESHIDNILSLWGIDIDKSQYVSDTDKLHRWKGHVVNHLFAASNCHSDYIIFADNDCWIVDTPLGYSWINYGIVKLENNPKIWMVSPNDGEPERMTQRISQQMFLVRASDFKQANFNQPGWDGNVNIPGGPLPEYWAMLEGRIELWLKQIDEYRYVCPSQFRYWHHNRIENGQFVIDRSRYV